MIEKTVLDYLNEKMEVPVYMERPEQPESEYVLVEKTSGRRSNHIGSATIALQSYAGSLLLAAELNEEVIAAMEEIVSLDEIIGVSLNSTYNFTDTSRKQYRYQAVYDIRHYL